ncbi:MAG: hypothetical protein LBV34_17315, partial [Nocardiopsaceae bacterium]|nr:hypothetical protein [Nocardiopsaceae bacterium]
MSDTSSLRQALRVPDDDSYLAGAPDIDRIIVRGRRLRWRRRLAAAGGALCAAAAVYGVVTGIAQLSGPAHIPPAHQPGPSQTVVRPSPNSHSPSPSQHDSMSPINLTPSPSASPTGGPRSFAPPSPT